MARYEVTITAVITKTGTVIIDVADIDAAVDKIGDLVMGESVAEAEWLDEWAEITVEKIMDEDGQSFIDADALLASAEQEA